MRTELRGHGSVVAACALSKEVCHWHAETLKADLRYDEETWQHRLQDIREHGFDRSYAREGAPGQGDGLLDTLTRLSIPLRNPKGSVHVLTATGHGLSAERVFPERAIKAAQQAAERIDALWA